MAALPENLLLKVVSEIHDPVTTTDELIPSGETHLLIDQILWDLQNLHYPEKDPAYVGRAKEVQKAEKATAIEAGQCPLEVLDELKPVMAKSTQDVSGSRRRQPWNRKHDLRSKTGRRFRKRTGKDPARRFYVRHLGKYCERIRNQYKYFIKISKLKEKK